MRLIGLAVALALNLFATSLAVEAQQDKVYRVGLLSVGSRPAPGSQPGILVRTLRDLGYVEGRNIVFDRRWAEGKNERFPSLAAELVALTSSSLTQLPGSSLPSVQRRPSLLSWSGLGTR